MTINISTVLSDVMYQHVRKIKGLL